jgi:aryl-alcohol dehydrogenase-like predicted oxidoreductase
MQYRKLGNSGLKVSAIGLGTNRFGSKVDENGVVEIMAAAMDEGINFFDTANVYANSRSEKTIGKALKNMRRSEVILATKFYMKMGEAPNDRGGSRKHIMDAVEGSLRRLDTDYIDLYQYHRWDQETPIEETLRALDDLITSGKVRYIGSSAFPSWMMATAQNVSEAHGWNHFVTEQPHFHMLERKVKEEVLPAASYYGIGILPYFPLAGGFLTGKYKRDQAAPAGSRGEESTYVQKYMTDANYDILEKLTAFAEDRGHTMGELAHSWLLAHPQVSSVISGATKVEHVIANAKAGDWQLTGAEFSEVNEILES